MKDYVEMKTPDGTIINVSPDCAETFIKCGYEEIKNERPAKKAAESRKKGE